MDTTIGRNLAGKSGQDGFILCNYSGSARDKQKLPDYVTSVDYSRAFPKSGIPDPVMWSATVSNARALAPVQVIKDYSGGAYLVYSYTKSIKFRTDKIRGGNTSLSGIFFDPVGL